MRLKPEDSTRIAKDMAFSVEVLVNTALALEGALLKEMRVWKPDCVVADSMAIWGKLIAFKLGLPFMSSTTTFAFNKYSARIMKQGVGDMIKNLLSIPKANRHIKRLREEGYPVKGVLSMIQNDNETNTIVYTSPEFQPYAETFSDRYAFVGPSIRNMDYKAAKPEKETLFISLGTVNTQKFSFFKNCIAAFKGYSGNVIMSVGKLIDISKLGEIKYQYTSSKGSCCGN